MCFLFVGVGVVVIDVVGADVSFVVVFVVGVDLAVDAIVNSMTTNGRS